MTDITPKPRGTAWSAIVGLLAVSMLLAGCSSTPKTYASPSELRTAFIGAGGKCAKPADVPESMVSAGAHAILCGPGVNMLIVFDSESAKNRYLAETLNGGDLQAVVGERWVVMTDSASKYAGGLGGTVKKG